MTAAEFLPGSAFWREAFALRGAATARVLPRMLVFALIAAIVTVVRRSSPWLAIRPDVLEASGLALGLLLVFRTAAGYERWWEARKLWGEIVNQSRNLAVAGRVYGPVDRAWQEGFAHWVIAFAYSTRATLRDQRSFPQLSTLRTFCVKRRLPSRSLCSASKARGGKTAVDA